MLLITEDLEWQQITAAANAANSTAYSYRDQHNTLNRLLECDRERWNEKTLKAYWWNQYKVTNLSFSLIFLGFQFKNSWLWCNVLELIPNSFRKIERQSGTWPFLFKLSRYFHTHTHTHARTHTRTHAHARTHTHTHSLAGAAGSIFKKACAVVLKRMNCWHLFHWFNGALVFTYTWPVWHWLTHMTTNRVNQLHKCVHDLCHNVDL